MYALVLLFTAVISCVMLAPGVETWLEKFPICEATNGKDASAIGRVVSKGVDLFQEGAQKIGLSADQIKLQVKCEDFVGYLAVYRICFIVTLFFLLMSLLMIGVRNSSSSSFLAELLEPFSSLMEALGPFGVLWIDWW